ncbi:hypothetical protein [Pseudogemmobacter faecipullorum]|uniref:Uncharacterized protein n=1 Tax=Pseudogemmobacter faecipullorum TaxID=2755041 RepID=A0ABS8CT48_9RHOB|nr:hypothetical protein [Pseudogemmobacter faecipullorum]MCB5412378.1 hypothetical protein [Pseudogemmobacter faecipullorum]
MSYVPQNYDEWEHCITVKCGIPLTADYVAQRIVALEDGRDFHTEKFIARWGAAHHARTLQWFREAQSRLAGAMSH